MDSYSIPLEKVPFTTFYPRWKYLCGTHFFQKKTFSSVLLFIPLEKVAFTTFYPLQKYLRGTFFFKNYFFKWTLLFSCYYMLPIF